MNAETPSPHDGEIGQSVPRAELRDAHGRRLGDILVGAGIITEEQKTSALEEKRRLGRRHLGEILLEMGFLDEDILAQVLASQLELPFVRPQEAPLNETSRLIADAIDLRLASRNRCVPVYCEDDRIVLAMEDPLDLVAIRDIELVTKLRVEPVVATPSDISEAIRRLYGTAVRQAPPGAHSPVVPEAPLREAYWLRLGDILVEEGLISVEQKRTALAEKEKQGREHLGEILVRMGYATEETIAQALALQLQVSFVRPDQFTLTGQVAEVLDLIDARLALHDLCIPLHADVQRVLLAMANPLDLVAIENIELATGRQVEVAVATASDITDAIGRAYEVSKNPRQDRAVHRPEPADSE